MRTGTPKTGRAYTDLSSLFHRIALADSDKKLEDLLKLYLAPLLLKLSSESVAVRNKVRRRFH